MQNSNNQTSQIERNLKGDYQFEIGKIMREGWQLTLQSKWIYLQMFMFLFVIVLVIVSAIIQYQGIVDLSKIDKETEAIVNILLSIVLAPFITAISLFGYHNSIGKIGSFMSIFALLSRSAIICIASLFISVLVGIGIQMLIVPGLYLLVATDFALLLIAEKKMRPFAAIALSIKMVTRYWQSFLLLLLIFFALMLAIVVTLGVALFWVGPLYYNVKGVLYRDLFTEVETQIDVDINAGESTFNA